MRVNLRRFIPLLICAYSAYSVAFAADPGFPTRPVHFIVGFDPGGATDTSARLVARKLSEKWGQPVIVENRPGADSSIAEDFVAHSAADGYTLLWASNAHTIIPNEYKTNYDAVKSFAPVSITVYTPDVLVVNPTAIPVNSVKELIATAKSKPGKLNFGSSGTGSAPYLEMALLMKMTGIDMTNVTYKGGAPTMVALLNGEIQLMFGSAVATSAQVKAGKFKALAIDAYQRIRLMPDLPTVVEATGLKSYQATPWNGVLAPAGTSKEIIGKLHDDLVSVLKSADVQETMSDQGLVPATDTPAEFAKIVADDISRWASIIGPAAAGKSK